MICKRLIAALLALLTLLSMAVPAVADVISTNPLLTPTTVEYVQTQDEFFNVLLLGIEQGYGNYHQSDWAGKPSIRECHTDVIMVLSFNKTKKTINLVSIPRDTLSYVPGVYGIYKINAAFNLADTNEQGFENIKATVSWVLGGIKIDAYCAVNMNGLVTLGDAMGGLDFFMDMTYIGSSSTRYVSGWRHLDGQGIMDYCRARTNATIDDDDHGRTRRCRSIVTSIIERLRGDLSMVQTLWDLSQSGQITFFTDLTAEQVLEMWYAVQTYNSTVGSYCISGNYTEAHEALVWWFTHTYQNARRETLYTVYGIDASPLPYVSIEYCVWLIEKGGFLTVHNIRQAKLIIDYARTIPNASAVMQSALSQLEMAYENTIKAFDYAASTLEENDRYRMKTLREEMESLGTTVAQLYQYPYSYSWKRTLEWDEDPLINQYNMLDWR